MNESSDYLIQQQQQNKISVYKISENKSKWIFIEWIWWANFLISLYAKKIIAENLKVIFNICLKTNNLKGFIIIRLILKNMKH